MSAFPKPAIDEFRRKRVRCRVIACGGRQAAYDAYVDALANEPEVCNLVLVDAEEPIGIAVAPWAHLRQRPGDGWAKPAGADDSHSQMMVVCMEAWFLADRAGLKRHFGGDLDDTKLPPPDQAETRTKASIDSALRQATRNTPAKEYRRIRDGAKLLAQVDPTTVRRHCKWCDRLFAALATATGSSVAPPSL
jgi:hypothetical protein